MNSSELGLDIKKTLTSKVSLGKVSGVDKTLQKAAKNYLLLGKISHNLNLINQNIINLVRAFGIEAREKEDAHFLKEDERAINFRVRKEKYIESKVRKSDPDGDSSGGILGFFIRKRLKQVFKKLATKVMLRLRKNEIFKKLVKTINRFKREIKNFFKKLDFKKIIVEWWREKGKPFVKGLLEKGFELLKKLGPLFKRALPRLTARLATIMASSAATGPFAPVVALVLTLGFVLYDGIMGAIDEIADGGNGFVGFFSGIIEGITFGIFDRKLIADKMYGAGGFISNFFKTVYEKIKNVVKISYNFISEKLDNIITPIFEKSKKDFDIDGKEKEYEKIVEEALEEDRKQKENARKSAEKESEYITGLANSNREKFEKKRRLVDEINTLEKEEYEAERRIAQAENKMPPKKPTEIPPPKRQEVKREEPAPAPAPTKPAPAPAPAPAPTKPAPAPAPAPAPKPEDKKKTKQQKLNDDEKDTFERAKTLVKELISLGLTNKHALKAILQTSAKESGISPSAKEMGAGSYIKQVKDKSRTHEYGTKKNLTGPERVREVFPQLKTMDGGKYMDDDELLKIFYDNEKFYDIAYGLYSPRGFKMGNTEPGDGYKYRGRGYIQITFKNTYKMVGNLINQPLESNPDLISSNPKIAAEAALMYLASSIGGKKVKLGIERMNKFESDEEALKFIILNVARGGAGINASHSYFKDENYAEQIKHAKEKGTKYAEAAVASIGTGGPDTSTLSNAFTVVEPATGKKIIYDSKEMFLGHRQQKKPVEYDVVNIKHIDNTKLSKNLPKKDIEKVDNASILLSRIA